ncbi:MAG: hypothetical protein CfClM3_1718 [Methanobrevibacter sp. CfCl-M3]
MEFSAIFAMLSSMPMYLFTVTQIYYTFQHKKTDIQIVFAIGYVTNCLLWLLYGFDCLNFVIIVPNIIGTAVSATLLLFVIKYGSNTNEKEDTHGDIRGLPFCGDNND